MDYPASDGTCVRDYVHEMNLASYKGLKWLVSGKGKWVFSLGTCVGFSAKEVIIECEVGKGRAVPHIFGLGWAGDAATLGSGSIRASEGPGWTPKLLTLQYMIPDAW